MTRIELVASLLVIASTVWAGRPLVTDDADPVEPPNWEVEVGAVLERVSANSTWHTPWSLAFGLAPQLELAFGGISTYVRHPEPLEAEQEVEHGSGLVDPSMGLKWQVFRAPWLNMRTSIVPAVTLPSPDHEKGFGSSQPAWNLLWILSVNVTDQLGVHLNAGRTWITDTDHDLVLWGVAVDVRITDDFQLVAEIFAEEETPGDSRVVQAAGGGRFAVADGLVLDLAAGTVVAGDGPNWFGTAGFTWTFTRPW